MKWVVDPAQSEIYFKVRHLMITTITGWIGCYEGTVNCENDNFHNADIFFRALAGSVGTLNAKRTELLHEADFLNVAVYPEILFTATMWRAVHENTHHLKGELTLKGYTKQVHLDAEFSGIVEDTQGNQRAGFVFMGKFDRSEFGLDWSRVTENGTWLIGREVKIHCNIQLLKTNST